MEKKISEVKCKRLVEYNKESGMSNYSPCNAPVKYKISYKSGVTKEICEEEVCGTHFQSSKKWSERMMRRLNYDTQFKFEKV